MDGGDEEDDEDEKFPDDDEEPVKNKSVDDFIQGNDEDDEEDKVIAISDIEDSPIVRKPAPAKRKLGPKVTDDAVSPPVASKPTTSKRPRKIFVADSSEDEKPKKVAYDASSFDYI